MLVTIIYNLVNEYDKFSHLDLLKGAKCFLKGASLNHPLGFNWQPERKVLADSCCPNFGFFEKFCNFGGPKPGLSATLSRWRPVVLKNALRSSAALIQDWKLGIGIIQSHTIPWEWRIFLHEWLIFLMVNDFW